MASYDKKAATVTVQARKSSEDSIELKSPRIARFAEATSIDSPIEASEASRAPFAEPRFSSFQPQPQPGDIGFGYINDRRSQHDVPHVEMPASPNAPLKSAMKLPGTAPRNFDNALKSPTFAPSILSPTWREEKLLEKKEQRNTKDQASDLKVKMRVRMAKIVLRFTNFSCSLIVLAMLSTTLTVFNATKNLPTRNNLPPWSPGTPRWPQITLLCIACVSLFFSIVITAAMCWGKRMKAVKLRAYYSIFAVAFFVVSIVMWATGAGIMQTTKNNGNGKDLWGWSCKNNVREKIFGSDVPYATICRLQNWSLVCAIIEIVVEVVTITVYGIVFYRFWSKRKLRKTMDARDAARSKLYMSQLRSGANTPGMMSPGFPGGPLSPREGGYNPMFSPRFAPGANSDVDAAEKGQAQTLMYEDNEQAARETSTTLQVPPAKKFTLQKPPMKSPKTPTATFADRPQTPAGETVTHTPAASEEPQYGAVPIPGAYASPVQSPTMAPPGGFQSFQQQRK